MAERERAARRPSARSLFREALNVATNLVDPDADEQASGLEEPERLPDTSETAPDGSPTLLPRHLLRRFVGREDAVRAVLDHLRRDEVLVTLVGAGGVGKTRIAVEVGRRVALGTEREAEGVRFPDGVRFVSLEDLDSKDSASERLLWSALAAGLRVDEAGDLRQTTADAAGRIRAAVLDSLRGRRALLILDNCEHLHRETLAGVVEAVCGQGDSEVRVLATSRKPLGLQTFETEVPVGVLSPPDPDGPVERLRESEAVRLFALHARPGGQPLAPGEAEAGVLRSAARICLAVDCIPLAIELAAFRARHYPTLEALLQAMEEAPELLSSDAAGRHDRHRTLEAAVRWSYDLLGRDEKRLFRRLAVFRGGWTTADARAVCLPDVETPRADALLTEILDARLTERGGMAAEPVYRFLNPIARYARRRLSGVADREEVQRAHAVHFSRLLLGNLGGLALGEGEAVRTLALREANVAEALWRIGELEPELGREVLRRVEESLPDLLAPSMDGEDPYPRFRRLYPYAAACRKLAADVGDDPTPALDPERWLKKLHRGLELQELFAGESDWEVLFGGREPSFKTLRDNIENRKWQAEALCTIAVLAAMKEREQARLMFACMVFVTFDWWDAYLKAGSKSDYLLDAWEHYFPDDALLQALRGFRSAYPESCLWRERARLREQWRSAAENLYRLQDLLRVAGPIGGLRTRVQRYLRAITNRYLAEALHYMEAPGTALPQLWAERITGLFRPPAAGRRKASAGQPAASWRGLFEEAARVFAADGDLFNAQWVLYQYADNLREAGDLEAAGKRCQEALDSELQELRGLEKKGELARDAFDLEVLANLYRVLADERHARKEPAEALAHHAAAVFAAYAFLSTEKDEYARTMYQEMVDRAAACLAETAARRPVGRDEFAAGAEAARSLWRPFWDGEPAPDFAALSAGAGREPAPLARVLFPTPPESVEALTAVDGEYARRIGEMMDAMPGHLECRGNSALPYLLLDFATLLRDAPEEA